MVTLRVYDMSGCLVRVLLDDRKLTGDHTAMWDGRDENGNAAASGVYFVRFESSAQMQARKIVLLK